MTVQPTTAHTPGVDYRATSVRVRYDELSAEVRRCADRVLGSRVVLADPPVTSGFTRAYAGAVTLADGRRVFLKATGPELPIPLAALRREAQVLSTVGALLPSVPLVASAASADGGQVLALQWVAGDMPGFPWSDAEMAQVREACEQVADVPAAAVALLSPVPSTLPTLLLDDGLRAALGGLALPTSLHGLPPWLPGRLDDLLAVASGATALVGPHLNHFDLRPDNLIVGAPDGVGPRRAFVLDWNWVCLGPAWCDWVGLLPTMQAQGRRLAPLIDSSPLSRDADPDLVDAWFAVVAVYMLRGLDHEAPYGTTTALRQHQRLYARIFLASLAEHRGWT